MISTWRDEKDNKMFVNVPEFKVDFLNISLPILAGFNEDSEESIICLHHIYKTFVDFIKITNHLRMTSHCSKLPYEQVHKLNQITQIFTDYLRRIGVEKFFPYINNEYFVLTPTDCVPYCEYVYESVSEKLLNIKMWLKERNIREDN